MRIEDSGPLMFWAGALILLAAVSPDAFGFWVLAVIAGAGLVAMGYVVMYLWAFVMVSAVELISFGVLMLIGYVLFG